MPQHAEFVIAADGIWIAVFAGYLLWMVQRSRCTRRMLERLRVPPNE